MASEWCRAFLEVGSLFSTRQQKLNKTYIVDRRADFVEDHSDPINTYLVFKAKTTLATLMRSHGITPFSRRHLREISLQIVHAIRCKLYVSIFLVSILFPEDLHKFQDLQLESITHTDLSPANIEFDDDTIVHEIIYQNEGTFTYKVTNLVHIVTCEFSKIWHSSCRKHYDARDCDYHSMAV